MTQMTHRLGSSNTYINIYFNNYTLTYCIWGCFVIEHWCGLIHYGPRCPVLWYLTDSPHSHKLCDKTRVALSLRSITQNMGKKTSYLGGWWGRLIWATTKQLINSPLNKQGLLLASSLFRTKQLREAGIAWLMQPGFYRTSGLKTLGKRRKKERRPWDVLLGK